MATKAGREADAMELIVTANVEVHAAPLGADRMIFAGTLDQIEEDIAATRRLGATELIFNAQFSPGADSTDNLIALMEQLWNMAHG
jgi:hypothetical protein